MDENPALIYEGSKRLGPDGRRPVPLVLVHDGGGTTFSYHCLEPLGRELWAIGNPHFDRGGWWEGGLPEMARHYVGLLARAMPRGGDILLGGWSLGGLLSLEMARQIAAASPDAAPSFRVLGMVWVDSIYPRHLMDQPPDEDLPAAPALPGPAELAAMKTRDKVNLNMSNARVAVSRWTPPKWGAAGPAAEAPGSPAPPPPPPTILLRAKDHVNNAADAWVDLVRSQRLLGWEPYSAEHAGFLRDTMDVRGGHFEVFEFDKIPEITKSIANAANTVERLGR